MRGRCAYGLYGQHITMIPVLDMVVAHKSARNRAHPTDSRDYKDLLRMICGSSSKTPFSQPLGASRLRSATRGFAQKGASSASPLRSTKQEDYVFLRMVLESGNN